jgi:hypothetical protein
MTSISYLFRRRKHAYERLFPHQDNVPQGDVRIVLADLKKFARLPDAPVARSSVTGQTDALATGVMIGRQEVVNRILAFINIDEQAFFNLRDETEHD